MIYCCQKGTTWWKKRITKFGQCLKEIDFSYGRCSLSCLGLAARKSNPERDSVLMVGLTALFKWLVSISISIPLQECHHY